MRSLILMSCLIALAGCASSNAGNLKKTAMADLGCPAKKLEVDQLQKSKAGSTYLVSGCGRSARYSVSRKVAVRITEVVAATAPPAPVVVTPAPPPPPQAPNAQQQADFNAFMQQHNDNFARQQVGQETSVNSPPPSGPGVSSSASQTGSVCLNGAYHACPTVESTAALGAYGVCKVDCAMGGNCSSCVVGAGDQCKREPGRDSSCK